MRGRLLFSYRPPRAHPILYAGLIVFGFVFLTGSLENLLRESRPMLYAVYAAPLAATAAIMAALWQSDTRIYDNGIAPARALIARKFHPFIAWDDMTAAYPAYYDVTGAFVSPFASSDGKVTQTGLLIESGQRADLLRFTPSRFVLGQQRSKGFFAAWPIVQKAFADRGKSLTGTVPAYSDDEKRQLINEATAPFLPFFAIVLLFSSAAPVLLLLRWLGLPIWASFAASLLLPLWTSLRSYSRSRARNNILNRLSKSTEAQRA